MVGMLGTGSRRLRSALDGLIELTDPAKRDQVVALIEQHTESREALAKATAKYDAAKQAAEQAQADLKARELAVAEGEQANTERSAQLDERTAQLKRFQREVEQAGDAAIRDRGEAQSELAKQKRITAALESKLAEAERRNKDCEAREAAVAARENHIKAFGASL